MRYSPARWAAAWFRSKKRCAIIGKKGEGTRLLPNAGGKFFLNCTPIPPQTPLEVEQRPHEAGAQTLEACMASSIPKARKGSLSLMCAGEHDAFPRAEPILK